MKTLNWLLVSAFVLALSAVPALASPNFTVINPTQSDGNANTSASSVVFHDSFSTHRDVLPDRVVSVGEYQSGVTPWFDLLVQLPDGTWLGPERNLDDSINAQSLPEGFRWQVTEGFGVLPNGEAWWTGPGTEAWATLWDAQGNEVVKFPFRIQIHTPTSDSSTSGNGGGSGIDFGGPDDFTNPDPPADDPVDLPIDVAVA